MNKRTRCAAIIGFMIAGLLLPAAAMAESKGDLNVLVGSKKLSEDDWDPVDRHVAFGVEATVGGASWPVALAVDTLVSGDDGDVFGSHIEMNTVELDLGVRKVWDLDATAMIGGGVALIHADVTSEGAPLVVRVDDDDDGVGFWLGASVSWTLGSHFNLGASLRWSKADVSIEGLEEGDAGGLFGGVMLGWGWPAK